MELNEDSIESNLESALLKSKTYANRGYKLSTNSIRLLKNIMKSNTLVIEKNIEKLENSNVNNYEIITAFGKQLRLIKDNFEKIPQILESDLEKLSKNNFSITLFGRTMAGKSTMMEILTNGNGSSIGKGAQRTTRDVRTYRYQNMCITDVPGIAAFEGEEDETIAFEEAKKSDLILFLLTDDAPQASEAECLKKIISLGKPVICIINVKVNIDEDISFKMFSRDIEKKMKLERLESIKSQFLDFSDNYGYSKNIPFVYVHLKSAYLAQKSNWKEYRNELQRISRFKYLEKIIIKEVEKNGQFYKLKSFSDIVLVPIIEVFEELCKQASESSYQGRKLLQKKRKLENWTNDFQRQSQLKISNFVKSLILKLKEEVPSFAENNYDNKNVNEKWSKILETYKIGDKAFELLNDLRNECEVELKEICSEIESDIKFSYTMYSDESIKTSFIFDTKKMFNTASSVFGLLGMFSSSNVLVAGTTRALVPVLSSTPLALPLYSMLVIGTIGSLLTDKEKKIRKAIVKMEDSLLDNIDNLSTDLFNQMINIIDQEIITKQLKNTIFVLNQLINEVFNLSDTQWKLTKEVNKKISEINKEMYKEALNYLGFEKIENEIINIVRIPGSMILILLENKKRFPDNVRRRLSKLYKEEISFVFFTDKKSLLLQAIGKSCKKGDISIEYINNEPRIGHITSLDELDSKTYNRMRLAQQLTELLIMK